MPAPRMLMILSENWTLTDGRNLNDLVTWARIAEDTGFDSVMISEHVVLGPDASDKGVMGNPRDYAAPGNQDPLMPWPNSLMLFSAIASVTERIRLVGAAVLAPLRHPLLLARELGTLDLISEGRLVVQPNVSWSKDEYAAMGVPFRERGKILSEQLEVMKLVFEQSPATHHGHYFDFEDIYLEPKAFRPEGPRMWFGGQKAHGAVVDPWIGLGLGYESLSYRTLSSVMVTDEMGQQDSVNVRATERFAGPELLVHGGVDFQVEDALRVGPFAALSVGQYTTDSFDCQPDNPACPSGNSVDGGALHGWISIGVRGAYTP